jgi:hypothetical protein
MERFIGTPSGAIPARERPTQLGRGVGEGSPATPRDRGSSVWAGTELISSCKRWPISPVSPSSGCG